MSVVLTARQAPKLRVDASPLQPAAFASMSAAEIEKLTLRHGRDALPIGDLFDVRVSSDGGDDASGPSLVIEGDCSRFDRLGAGLAAGRLEVRGSVGDLAGLAMTGGTLVVAVDAGDLAGCSLRGGRLEVNGSVGDFAASALPGDMDGMRGGTFVVRENSGARCGDRMRRGTLVVYGDTGDFLASRMVAGTIAVGGKAGAHAGWGMRRGSIVFAGARPQIAPTFAPVRSNADVFWQLLARDLRAFGGPFARLASRSVERYAGDLAALGKGELLLPSAG